jgi:hypothetical protein
MEVSGREQFEDGQSSCLRSADLLRKSTSVCGPSLLTRLIPKRPCNWITEPSFIHHHYQFSSLFSLIQCLNENRVLVVSKGNHEIHAKCEVVGLFLYATFFSISVTFSSSVFQFLLVHNLCQAILLHSRGGKRTLTAYGKK